MQRGLLFSLILSLFSGGCSTINREAIHASKRVALIGFDGKITEGGIKGARIAQYFQDQQFAPKLYGLTQAVLKQSFQWEFVPLDALKTSSTYEKYHSKKLSQAYTWLGYQDFHIMLPGIMQYFASVGFVADLGPKKSLMDELKVDALLLARFDIEPASTGIQRYIPFPVPVDVVDYNCNVSLLLYKKDEKDPVWDNGSILGEQAKKPSLSVYKITFPDQRQAAVASSFSNALRKAVQEVKQGS